ncbi:hypothetical protein BDR05DRAFT_952623 [Suillus weaverae]|nr:hypothetical protein BDR05DRAFT_952623 [Suillus weaverae]
MAIVSNDPSWWPSINSDIVLSYWIVAAGAVVVYDWVLTLGKEIELIWHTVAMPSVSLTDAGCNIMYYTTNGTNVVVVAMLGVITIARLRAMYQRSRNMLVFLVIIFLAVIIASGVITIIGLKDIVAEELILSGTYMCYYGYGEDGQLLASMIWTFNTVWEVLALCLSVWIAVKHFRDLRRLGPSTGSTIRDCFRGLIKSHVLYFASLVLSPELWSSNSMGAMILYGALRIFLGVQMFVLGPRLILSVREYHAKLVADSDAETSMTSIVFQERVHVPTGSTV